MTRAFPLRAAVTFAYGGVLINTMPIWLASLVAKTGPNEALPGILASIVLLGAAAGSGWRGALLYRHALSCAALLVIALPLSAALSPAATPAIILSGGAVFGLAYGLLLQVALRAMLQTAEPFRVIGDTIAAGVVASLVVLAVIFARPDATLAILSVLSVFPAAMVRASDRSSQTEDRTIKATWPGWQIFGYLPFFMAMGAYWAFLEVFAELQGLAPVSGWLSAGLLASGLGSALAARIAEGHRARLLRLSLLAAAASGAASYGVPTAFLFGPSVVANGFALFVFVPLYLGAGPVDQSGTRMGIYLAGFALGGAAGAAIIASGGYGVLALAILLSGLIPVRSALFRRSDGMD